MGFMKVRECNIAMLARQVWCLVSMEDNLMGKVFKAKYFSHLSLLDAKLGSNPSYVWRSIFEAQEGMKKGARVRISNGKKINIWLSPWLNNLESAYIQTEQPPNLLNAKVRQLLDVNADVEKIVSVLVSNRDVEDKCSWIIDAKGKFCVKSFYKTIYGEIDEALDKLWGLLCWKLLRLEKLARIELSFKDRVLWWLDVLKKEDRGLAAVSC
ncbi:uncharacterized protein LOC126672690 [Mercurialis annua]|uniref:uncharacterized protein LOC126672690 n=1 Tax=Mercurialis annua TaxID=3986 RepID=UPI00215F388C|nr:uncharacterized protein LOC126672690 [Mercurialis annua]